jgi:ethanolaminephosphotransferase
MLLAFYTATFEEFHTGILHLGVVSGPVEGLLASVITSLVSFSKGNRFWSQTVVNFPFIQLPLNFIIMMATLLIILSTVYSSFQQIRLNNQHPSKSIIHILNDWMKYGSFFAAAGLWPLFFPSLHQKFVVPYCVAVGVCSAHIVANIIVAHLTKWSLPSLPASAKILIASALIDGASSIFLTSKHQYSWRLQAQSASLVLFAAVSGLLYVRFATSAIKSICHHLKIECFRIKQKK